MDELVIDKIKYTSRVRLWLDSGDHYLHNAPPGALFAVGVAPPCKLLTELKMIDVSNLVGVCVVGRPVARGLPQDGTWGEITRMFLIPNLPYGLASKVLQVAAQIAKSRNMHMLIAYHDRTRHTGCIYKKAGFSKGPVTKPNGKGWASRNRPKSQSAGSTSKRRWHLLLANNAAACADANATVRL